MENIEIPEDKQFALRDQTDKEREEFENEDTPKYQVKLDLATDEIESLTTQVFETLDALKEERRSLKLENIWKECDKQYYGEVKKNQNIAFNLHVHQTKIKEDAIVRALNESVLDSDPMFDVTPRPETARRRDGDVVAQKQTEFIDYSMDEEVRPHDTFVLINHSAVRKYVGHGKLCWKYCREKRRREEVYEGENVLVAIDERTGQKVYDNPGLKKFLKAYPNPSLVDGYEKYVKKLAKGQKIEIVVEYWDTVENNPGFEYVKNENFYVANSTKGYNGLRNADTFERIPMTWQELEEEKDRDFFKDIDKVKIGEGGEVYKDWRTREYDIIEATVYFTSNKNKDKQKIKAYFCEKTKTYLGSILYPYYGFDTDYIPYYVIKNDDGYWGGGKSVTYFLKDSQIAQNALLSLALHGTYVRNIVTPVVRSGSEIESIFLEHKFSYGNPLPVDPLTDDVGREVDFLQFPNQDLNGSLALVQQLKRLDSDSTGVSDYVSGRESPTDPNAPAAKTIALLQQAGINIKDYIRNYIPSVNILATNILQLYYQMSSEDRVYRQKGKSAAVTGTDIFGTIGREEMAARTIVQSRASSFAFDKVNEKQENLAMYQLIKQDPYAMQLPELQHKALVAVMRSWSPRWRNLAETDVPNPQEFQQQMGQVAMQAIQTLMQQAQQQQQVTGVAPNMDELMSKAPDAIKQAQTLAMNPQLAEED